MTVNGLFTRVEDFLLKRSGLMNTTAWQRWHWARELLRESRRGVETIGYDWGDPETTSERLGDYRAVLARLRAHLGDRASVLELGSYGGKWTRYLLRAGRVICVDLYDRSFEVLRQRFSEAKHLEFYRTRGDELRGIATGSVDLVFSIDTLVRVPRRSIRRYLLEMARVLRAGGVAILHLPWEESALSRAKRFTRLSRAWLTAALATAGFDHAELDGQTLRHGVLVVAKKASLRCAPCRGKLPMMTLDLAKSRGAWAYDLDRGEFVLDLFGQYSSLPLGYNHPIFDEPAFREECLRACSVKVATNAIATKEAEAFQQAFAHHPAMAPFRFFHFVCTGALGVEAALKAARDYRGSKTIRIITFKESFHGNYGFGAFASDRFGSVRLQLDGFPAPYVERFDNPVIRHRGGEPSADAALRERVLTQIDERCRADHEREIIAVLVEPIQCTAGDLRFDPAFLIGLRTICSRHDIPLVFDEIQTGFGGTGTMWYFEQCGFVPDLVVFGKKVQLAGFMAQERFGTIFGTPWRLEATWDGDLQHMIRSRYILDAYERFKILDNVRERGAELAAGLRQMPRIRHVRQAGLLIAFDFDSQEERDAYFLGMQRHGAITLSTQEKTVRWRPNLALGPDEAQAALEKTTAALAELDAVGGGAVTPLGAGHGHGGVN